MSNKRARDGASEIKEIKDPRRVTEARIKLEHIVVRRLGDIIEQCITALAKRQHEFKEVKLESDYRTPHDALLDSLRVHGIDSGSPVELILMKLPTRSVASEPILSQFRADFQNYRRLLWKWNEAQLRRSSSECRDFFTEFVSQLTFNTLFDNDMWAVGRDLDAIPGRFPTLSTELQGVGERPVLGEINRERKVQEGAEKERKVEMPDIVPFVEAMVAHADSRAQHLVVEGFVQDTLGAFVAHESASLKLFLVELEKKKVAIIEPGVDAVKQLRDMCNDVKELWQSVTRNETASHSEVRQFLAEQEQHMNQLELKYKVLAERDNYDVEYEALVRRRTISDRLDLCGAFASRLSSDTDDLIRTSVVVADILGHRSSLAFAFAAKRSRTDEKKNKNMDLDYFGQRAADLAHFIQEKIKTEASSVDEDKVNQELKQKQVTALTNALHLDFTEWVRSTVTAIGRAFIDGESTPGQLKQRVQSAIMESKDPVAHNLFRVRTRELQIRDRIQAELASDLKEGMEVMGDIQKDLDNLQKYYEAEMARLKSLIHSRVFMVHDPWMRLKIPTSLDTTDIMRGMETEFSPGRLGELPKKVMEMRHDLLIARTPTNLETMSRQWIDFTVVLMTGIRNQS